MDTELIKDWKALVPAGTDAFFVAECGSTNNLATEAGHHGMTGPTWYVAGKQTAGRGRRGREWTSEAGNLFCSYLFKPKEECETITALPFIVALAVRDTLIALGCHPEQIKCKWPNDVLVDERKISGILIESSASSGKKPDFIVIGIGINLTHKPDNSMFPAASLQDTIGSGQLIPDKAFKQLAANLHQRLDNWSGSDMSALVDEWSSCAWGIGARREIRTHNEAFHATVIGLGPDGGLNLRLDDGTSKRLYAGDVFGI